MGFVCKYLQRPNNQFSNQVDCARQLTLFKASIIIFQICITKMENLKFSFITIYFLLNIDDVLTWKPFRISIS